jgi:hypothetical protein
MLVFAFIYSLFYLGAEVSTDSTNTDILSKASTGQSSPVADASINKE